MTQFQVQASIDNPEWLVLFFYILKLLAFVGQFPTGLGLFICLHACLLLLDM